MDHLSYHKTDIIRAKEIFNVVIVLNPRPSTVYDPPGDYQAYLTYGHPTARQVAFKANPMSTIEEALLSLVEGTGEEFAKRVARSPVLMVEQAHGEVHHVLHTW